MDANTKQPTCAGRVRAEWKRVKADLEVFMENIAGNEETGEFYDYGLGFDYVPADTFSDQPQGYHRYQFSWGGPSDELRFYSDAAANVYTVSYVFLDWWDGAEIDVTDEACVGWLIDWLADTGSFEAALLKAQED